MLHFVVVTSSVLSIIRWVQLYDCQHDSEVTMKDIHTIDPFHKSQNASVPYPTMQHFLTEMCTCVHISVTKWCIEGYLHDALWDLWDGSVHPHLTIAKHNNVQMVCILLDTVLYVNQWAPWLPQRKRESLSTYHCGFLHIFAGMSWLGIYFDFV